MHTKYSGFTVLFDSVNTNMFVADLILHIPYFWLIERTKFSSQRKECTIVRVCDTVLALRTWRSEIHELESTKFVRRRKIPAITVCFRWVQTNLLKQKSFRNRYIHVVCRLCSSFSSSFSSQRISTILKVHSRAIQCFFFFCRVFPVESGSEETRGSDTEQ